MASLPVYDRSGEEVGSYEIELSDLTSRINKQLLHDAVVMYQANLRLGSAKTKTRAEVSGSTQKLYRQKGTGNARGRLSAFRRTSWWWSYSRNKTTEFFLSVASQGIKIGDPNGGCFQNSGSGNDCDRRIVVQ